VNSIGMEFVLVPAGEVTMGIPDQGSGPAPAEGPPQRVRITHPFWLGRHEVTVGQFQAVMKVTKAESSPPDRASTKLDRESGSEPDDESFPMVDVTWNETDVFCRRLSQRSEERAAGRHYRLPTEAEWEYACRSGTSEPYRWRPKRRPDDVSGEAAGIEPALPITSVGSYPPNAFGLCDMRGNARQWCADWFDRDYYVRSPVDDPHGPPNGYVKVVRGGDWRFIGESCHIDYPILPPWKSNPVVGFHVVCEERQETEPHKARVGHNPFSLPRSTLGTQFREAPLRNTAIGTVVRETWTLGARREAKLPRRAFPSWSLVVTS